MILKTYLKQMQPEQREEFANRLRARLPGRKLSMDYLKFIAYGAKPCASEVAMAIEVESKRQVKAETLRNDIADLYNDFKNLNEIEDS